MLPERDHTLATVIGGKMFGRPFRVGRLFGVDITLSWSFLLVMAVLSFQMALRSGRLLPGLVMALVSLALVFGSVLLHELGHALVARRLGIPIAEIELHFFGGAAKMLAMPKTPRDEILVAVAGPLTSLGLAAVAGALRPFVGDPMQLLTVLLSANVMLGIFNLLPALPMDGGRILRAALTPRYGSLRATGIAVRVARVIAVGLGAWALFSGNLFGVAIAVFVWMLGTRELAVARMMHRLTPGVEVLDRTGRAMGQFTSDGAWVPSRPDGAVWTEAPTYPQGALRTERHALVRGPDGRLWIVTERRQG